MLQPTCVFLAGYTAALIDAETWLPDILSCLRPVCPGQHGSLDLHAHSIDEATWLPVLARNVAAVGADIGGVPGRRQTQRPILQRRYLDSERPGRHLPLQLRATMIDGDFHGCLRPGSPGQNVSLQLSTLL